MKALTITQPWASLIIHGGKDVENRKWPAPRKLIGERIAIHSSKRFNDIDLYSALSLAAQNGVSELEIASMMPWPLGSIIGTVKIVACVDEYKSPWFFGDYGFVLSDPRPLAAPIAFRGALGFWTLPAEIEIQIKAAL